MKTKIKRHSRSVLSVVLAVCMVLSCMTVGIIATDAAYDNSERVGALSVAGYIYFIKPSDWTYASLMVGHSSYSSGYNMSNISGTNLYYVNQSAWSDSTEFAFFDVNNWGGEGNSISARASYAAHSSTVNSTYAMNSGSTYLIATTANSPTNYSDGYSAMNATLTVKTMLKNGSSYAETTTKCGTFSASNGKKLNGNGSSTSSSISQTNGTATLETARTNTATISQSEVSGYTFKGWKTSKDTTGSGLTTGNYSFTNSGSAATVYAYYDLATAPIDAPTNVKVENKDSHSVNDDNGATSSQLTWTAVNGAASYEIYKGTTKVGTSETNSYSISNLAANSGTYKVKTVPLDTSTYHTSDYSASSATLTVYKPVYSLLGNVDSTYLASVNGSASTATAGWNMKYQDAVAVNQPVAGSPGKYYITITTADESTLSAGGHNSKVDIGVYHKDNQKQYAFRTGTGTDDDPWVFYNNKGLDYKVPDTGVDESENLFVQIIDGAGTDKEGGALELKPNTTYTIYIDQTKTNLLSPESNPNGQLTITTSTKLTTKVMKQDFNATSGEYNTAVEDATVGTATASPSESAQGATSLTSTLSASATDSNYEFKGWYTDAACTTAASVTNNQITINSSTTLYALFQQKKPAQVDVSASVQGDGGSVSITSGAVSGKAYKGADVTFTATPAEGKKVNKWYVNDIEQPTAGNTLTVANIQNNTVVKVSFTESTEILFTVASNPTGAALTVKKDGTSISKVSGKDYYSTEKGDSIALTAGTLSGNTFKKWVITYPDGTKVESTNSTYTFKPKNNFKAVAYYGVNGTASEYNFEFWKNGNNPAGGIQMTLYSGAKYNNKTNIYKTTISLTANQKYYGQFYKTGTSYHNNNENILVDDWRYFTKTNQQNGYFQPSESGTYTVLMALDNDSQVVGMILKGDIDVSGSATEEKDTTAKPSDAYKTIYAKNGSIGSDNGGTCKWGNTTLTAGGTLYKDELAFPRYKDETDYKTYYYKDDVNTYITAQTTITRGGSNGGWAVRAYVVNGETFPATKKSDGVYTAQITVPKGSGNLEVTPVYYNTKAEAANEYVKFYADATSLDGHWGNTIAFYTWYGSDDVKNDGTYPGQPMLKDGSGKYYAFVAKHYINDNGTVSDKAIKGVLLDNYWENETVHKKFDSYSGKYHNLQTYDYLDPVKIASIDNVDTIQFTFKYKQNKNDVSSDAESNTLRQNIANSNSHLASKYSDKHNYDTSTDKLASNFATDTYYKWEYLTNYDGQHVNLANQTIATEGDPLYVVSVGNQNWQKTGSDQQNIGKWATVWKVYDKSGTHLMTAPPSYFIERTNTTAYNSVISNYKNNPVLISYEHEEVVKDADGQRNNGYENNSGIRVDGRWLYSKSTDQTEALIKVVTVNGANYKLCPEGGTADIGAGFNTAAAAAAAADTAVGTYYGTDVWFNNRTTEAQMRLNLGNGYKFVGFKYMKNGAAAGTVLGNEFSDTIADYVDIPADGTAANLTIDTTYRIVAVVEKLPAAAFHISHEKYGASLGNGYYYVTAQVVTSDGTVVAPFVGNDKGDQADMANITHYYSEGNGYKIKITLRTEPIGDNTFIRWLKNNNGSYDVVPESEQYAGSNIPVEDTLTVPFTDIFNQDGTLKIQSLNYYSDLGLAGNVSVVHYLLGSSKGTGKTTNTVTVKQNGTAVKTFAENEKVTNIGPEYIKYDESNPYTLEITLKTTPEYVSDFENFYWSNDGTKVMSVGTDGIRNATSVDKSNMTAVVTINVNDFFINDGEEKIFDKTKNSQTFYSSLDTALSYTIKYQYTSKQYGLQYYQVTDKFTKEEFATYVSSKTYTTDDKTGDSLPTSGTLNFYQFNPNTEATFLAIKSPYEKNLREQLTWDLRTSKLPKVNYFYNNKQFSLTVNATPTNIAEKVVTYKFPFGVTHKNGGTECEKDAQGRIIYLDGDQLPGQGYSKELVKNDATFATPYMLNHEEVAADSSIKPIFVTAPQTIYKNEDGNYVPYNFQYWSIMTTETDTQAAVEVARCYYEGFNFSIYQDYTVTPIYTIDEVKSADERAKLNAREISISFTENARNQWNNGGGGNKVKDGWKYQGDRIFSNFIVDFARQDNVQLNNTPDTGVTTGVLIDRIEAVDGATKTGDVYAEQYKSTESTAKTNAEQFIRDGTDNYGEGHEYLKSVIALNKLDNKNRIEFTQAFPNISHSSGQNTGRKNYVYRAYAYMVEKNGTIQLSKPIYFTIKDIAEIANGYDEADLSN